jgi:hypothetical protein
MKKPPASERSGERRRPLRSDDQMPSIEMSELGAALLLHQRMFSVDERAVFPRGGARGLMRVSSV